MKLQRREILLFIGNCRAHPATELSNIKLVFLPPNTTSRLQPCDAGIIANVKSLYRKRLLRHVLAQMDEAESATERVKRVNVLGAISWLHSAWAVVSEVASASVSPSAAFIQLVTHCRLSRNLGPTTAGRLCRNNAGEHRGDSLHQAGCQGKANHHAELFNR